MATGPVITMMILRGILALLLVAGGLSALRTGFRLYLNGVGLKKDGSAIEFAHGGKFNLKASLKNVGIVVMITSAVWGYLGYLSRPTYTQGPDTAQIAMAQDAETFERTGKLLIAEGHTPENWQAAMLTMRKAADLYRTAGKVDRAAALERMMKERFRPATGPTSAPATDPSPFRTLPFRDTR